MDRIRVIGGILNEQEEKAVNDIKTYRKAPFKRIRRITGYLVGDLSRFNNAKLSEVNERVKHNWGD